MKTIRGYKIFEPDWTCRGYKFEVGNIYEEDVEPKVCSKGFHFCKRAIDCFKYYAFDPNNKVAEVIALGDVAEKGDKCCTNKIKIEREITWEEMLTLVNTGKTCTGLGNSGHHNNGDYNSGHCNSGHLNSGDHNGGHCNSGHCNSGGHNSGNYNSGYCNSGNYNNGNYNSGHYNSGHYNSGYRNSGNYNTGSYNSGNHNTGDCNKASYVAGCFNTQSHKLYFFDKETDMTFEQWRDSEAYDLISRIDLFTTVWVDWWKMSDEEKAAHPEHKTLGGYLKTRSLADCYNEWWSNLTKAEKQVIMSIPNFDAEKFYEITSIVI